MALPGGAAGFTLTGGPYDDPAFQGMAGKLTLSVPVTHVATGERVRKTWDFSIDYNGQFSVGPLPWTDDPAFTPTGFTYTVQWQAIAWKDTPGNLTFQVPQAAGSTVDFDPLVPVTGGGQSIPLGVYSVNGHAGAVKDSDLGIGASFVVHGTNASVARPVTTMPVVWYGSASPANADSTLDVWIPTSSDGGAAALQSLQSALAAKADLAGGVVPDAELPARLQAAALALKADLSGGAVPDAQLPTRLSDVSLRAAYGRLARRQIGTGVMASNQAALWTTTQTHRIPIYVPTSCTDLVLTYSNYNVAGTSPPLEADGVNTYTVRAAVEVAGVVYPLTCNGSRTITLEGGGSARTDPLAVEVAAGSIIWVRTYISATGTGWTINYRSFSNGGGSGTGDLTAAGSAAISAGDANQYGPVSVEGVVPDGTRAVAIVGDSIAYGQGDTNGIGITDFSGAASAATAGKIGGFIARALGTTVGHVQAAVPGERVQNAASAGGHYRRGIVLSSCTHAICNYGINDVRLPRTLAQVQADLLTFWTSLALRRVKVWQTTLTPSTTSTDSWATTANQTLGSYEGVRTSLNDWIRGGAPINPTSLAAVAVGTPGALVASATGHPLAGYFDVADMLETARNSGLWKVNGTASYLTADGTHPTPAGHALAATAITVANLT